MNYLELFKKYESAEWNITGKNLKEGLNCFSLCSDWLRTTGHDVPDKDEIIGKYRYSNIHKLWEEEKDQTVEEMKKYLLQWGYQKKKVPFIGDILIVENEEHGKFPCIYAGNNKMATMIEGRGFKILKMSRIKILEVFRGTNL